MEMRNFEQECNVPWTGPFCMISFIISFSWKKEKKRPWLWHLSTSGCGEHADPLLSWAHPIRLRVNFSPANSSRLINQGGINPGHIWAEIFSWDVLKSVWLSRQNREGQENHCNLPENKLLTCSRQAQNDDSRWGSLSNPRWRLNGDALFCKENPIGKKVSYIGCYPVWRRCLVDWAALPFAARALHPVGEHFESGHHAQSRLLHFSAHVRVAVIRYHPTMVRPRSYEIVFHLMGRYVHGSALQFIYRHLTLHPSLLFQYWTLSEVLFKPQLNLCSAVLHTELETGSIQTFFTKRDPPVCQTFCSFDFWHPAWF